MKDFELSELFLASDGNDKYFYGEIIRKNNIVIGKIYIRDHIIISKVENCKYYFNNCFEKNSNKLLEHKLSKYLDDTVILILNHNLLNLEKKVTYIACGYETNLN